MHKHYDIIYSHLHTQLGILVNTRSLALSISDDKMETLIKIILTTWHNARKSFTLREIASLLGLVAHLVMATLHAKHTHLTLQHAVFLAIKFNSNTVLSNRKSRQLTDLLTSKNISIKYFYLAKAHNTL